MDVKQFELFQQTVQFAVDERRAGRGSRFNMSTWFSLQKRGDRATQTVLAQTVFETVEVGGSAWRVINEVPLCKTSACLAGTGVMLHGGDRFAFHSSDDPDAPDSATVITDDGRIVGIATRATELFGFTDSDASIFYMTNNTINEIVERARGIALKHGYEIEVI